MEYSDPKLARKREIRTRAPTACQTCRLRKTRCDNARPTCSYCSVQGVECNYPETSPQQNQAGFDPGNPSNQEVMQRLNHIAGLLEEIKSEGGSTSSSTRSLKESFFELAMQTTSPVADPGSNSHGTAGFEDRAMEHDPRLLYIASSGEHMLRWPIFNKVITEAEKHIRSFLLDSLDNRSQSVQPPRQLGIGHYVDEIPKLCKKYFTLCHRRNPLVDLDHLDRYAKEVTIQGLGWDGPSCQVLLVCALASCTSSVFIPLGQVPSNLDTLPTPPLSDANMDLAETYFHAAKQRFGFLHTSPTDIQCFLLAGSYLRHALRPLEAWFCFQQASCRLEVRLRSLCREQWTADDNYHNLESRLYWSCIQAEHEMQGELPLWSSGLEGLGYSDPFPKFSPKSTSSYDMNDGEGFNIKPTFELDGNEEEKGWKFYIGTICNRRTTNDLLADMWRHGEKRWTQDIPNLLRQTGAAEEVVGSWYKISLAGIQSKEGNPNPDLKFFFRGRYLMASERIYRPNFYLAMHYHSMPAFIRNKHEMWREVFEFAQKAIDGCVEVIPNYWWQFRHEWIWNVIRASFCCALHITAAVLYQLEAVKIPNTWQVRIPHNWAALVRVSIRTMKHWSAESMDIEVMRSILERMYTGTCRLANVRPDLHLI